MTSHEVYIVGSGRVGLPLSDRSCPMFMLEEDVYTKTSKFILTIFTSVASLMRDNFVHCKGEDKCGAKISRSFP